MSRAGIERRLRRLERMARELRRSARRLSGHVERWHEATGADIYVYPPRPPAKQAPPQEIVFCAWYRDRLEPTTCPSDSCQGTYEYCEDLEGVLGGTQADTDIPAWWSTQRQRAWDAYNEWFDAPGAEQVLRTAYSLEVGRDIHVNGIWNARKHGLDIAVCGDAPEITLERATYGYPYSGAKPAPYSLADWQWDTTGPTPELTAILWWVMRPNVDLYPTWYSTLDRFVGSTGWWWGWRLGTQRCQPSLTLNSRWRWDDSLSAHRPEEACVQSAGDVDLAWGLRGRAWLPGGGRSLWDMGARRLVVRWAYCWMWLDDSSITPRFNNPLGLVAWKARSSHVENLCTGQRQAMCVEAKVGSCVCIPPSASWTQRCPGPPCFADGQVYMQAVTFVEHTQEIPAIADRYREMALILTGATIDPGKQDDPLHWRQRVVSSLRRDWDYLEFASVAMADWYYGKTDPGPNTWKEVVVSDQAVLAWRPSDASKNAIAMLLLPKACLPPYRLSSNPMPTTPPADWDDQNLASEIVGWCWTGSSQCAWLEDEFGNPLP